MTNPYLAPLAQLSGVGGVREAALHKSGLETVLDLLLLAPTRYRTIPAPVPRSALVPSAHQALCGVVVSARKARQRRGGTFLDLTIDAGGLVRVCFYNRGWLKDRLAGKDRVLVTGRVSDDAKTVAGQDLFVVRSEVEEASVLDMVLPVHPAIERVAEGTLRRLVRQALDRVAGEPDPLEDALRADLALAPLHESLRRVHEPCRGEDLGPAGLRLLFDRMLGQALAVRDAVAAAKGEAVPIPAGDPLRARIRGRIPFPLTPGQSEALDQILDDLERPVAMRRLLVGDVGSGKTAVAAGAILAAVAAKRQALFVAPTDALAAQHFATLSAWLHGTQVRLAFVSGSVGQQERRAAARRAAAGDVDVMIGTHAALSASLRLPRLALVVFDEQHRFGVLQRLSGREPDLRPHVLSLSATPIPRSLSLALFGEIDVSRIAGRPRGTRTPATSVCSGEDAYAAVRAAVLRGERAFVVFPSIDGTAAPGVEREGRALVARGGALGGVAAGFLHGGMAQPAQAAALADFRAGRTHVLVCTVIVEVGIDVPEATVMVVLGAERFGLATLHQLRGRVGRGDRPGRALLVPSLAASHDQRARLDLLASEPDGFRIAEADLDARGPGDFCGVRQHGFGGVLPLPRGGDAPLAGLVTRAADVVGAAGYDRRRRAYYAALGRALRVRYDPKDPV